MSTTIHLTADNFNGSPDFFNHRDTIPLDGSGRKILEIPCGSQRSVTINAGR